MEIRVERIPHAEGGGCCARVVGHQWSRLVGDGESEEEALRSLANVMEDYREIHGELHVSVGDARKAT